MIILFVDIGGIDDHHFLKLARAIF